jgi:hypothetical protein
MIESSPSIGELCKALHGAQGVLTGVVKDAKNPHFKNRYATLEAVLDTARPALQANGLIVSQAPGRMVDGCVEITTMLAHVSGEWMRSTLHVPLAKRDPQGLGSAVTYGLRYALMAALCVPPTDDDGEAAMPSRQIERPAPRTNGNTAPEPTASQRMAREMSARLWKVSGEAAVKLVTGDETFRQQFRDLDEEDRQRVGELIKERRAIA